MEKPWKKYIPGLCGALGALLLAGMVRVCFGLERGGTADHAAVAAVLLVLAALALLLLRLEGCGRDTLLVLLLPVGAAMLARALCMDYAGSDYNNFLSHWYRFFQENGGFQAVAKAVGDYNVPYLYFMAFISYLSTPDLYLIKLFSLVFDVALAWGSLRLVRVLTKDRQGSRAPLIAFAAALLLPTVVLNGAFWGQCDSIYGALAIHAAALLLEEAGSVRNPEDGLLYRGQNPLEVTLLVNSDNDVRQGIAARMSETLTGLGAAVTMTRLPWSDFTAALAAGQFDLYIGEVRLPGDFDPSALITGALNYGGFYSGELTLALAQWRSAAGNARTQAAQALWEEFAQSAPLSPLCFKRGSLLMRWGIASNLQPTRANPFYQIERWTIAG